jgi:hypothetical protein
MTHTWRCCCNHHLCMLTSPAPQAHLPMPAHQKPSSHICISYYKRKRRMIYIGLCFPNRKQTTDCNLRWNKTLLRVLFGRHVFMEGTLLYLVRCDVLINIAVFLYVISCSVLWQHQHFTDTFASIRTEGESSRIICNGASVPDCILLQPTRQWPSLIFFWMRSYWGPRWPCAQAMTAWSFFITWNGILSLLPVNKYTILNFNPPPIVHITVCAVSNTTH